MSSEAAADEDDALLHSKATNATEVDTIVTKSSSKPRSFVWKYMKKVGNKAVCSPCKKELTINQFTTSNLIAHLKNMELLRRVPIKIVSFMLEVDS